MMVRTRRPAGTRASRTLSSIRLSRDALLNVGTTTSIDSSTPLVRATCVPVTSPLLQLDQEDVLPLVQLARVVAERLLPVGGEDRPAPVWRNVRARRVPERIRIAAGVVVVVAAMVREAPHATLDAVGANGEQLLIPFAPLLRVAAVAEHADHDRRQHA